ncbi:MAG: hypothetical protein GWN55_06895 [Phycisphaerae bacterium]|nr:hypothetical protein [Phycisphaerae bacterium]
MTVRRDTTDVFSQLDAEFRDCNLISAIDARYTHLQYSFHDDSLTYALSATLARRYPCI